MGPEEFEICEYCNEEIIDDECGCPEIDVFIEEELRG